MNFKSKKHSISRISTGLMSAGLIIGTAYSGTAIAAQDAATAQAKDQLAPHSLMVESSLKGMLADVNALKAQLETVSNPASTDSLKHAQIYQKDIQSDLDRA